MRYVPSAVPNEGAGLRRWLADELRRVAASLAEQESVQLAVRGTAPTRPADGMIAYADGVLWNPGAGVGFYGYESGAWVKL